MRRIAFIVAVLGVVVLALFLNHKEITVESYSELEKLEVNQKVFLEGRVEGERFLSSGNKLFVLDSGIEVLCSCVDSFGDSRIEVIGIVSEFNLRKQVEALEIRVQSEVENKT